METIVQLSRLHGGDAQGERGHALGRLHNISLMLPAGVHALVGRAADGTVALCEMLAGRRKPRIGSVTVLGREPVSSPVTRRRIGSLLHRADLPPASSVAGALRLAGTLRQVDLSAALEPLSLGALAARSVASLRRDEARAVELAIALSLPNPLVLALHEPLSAVASIDRAAVRQHIAAHADAGTCVVLTTSVPSDAEDIADTVHFLHDGRLANNPSGDEARALEIWLDADEGQVRDFAAALSQHPELAGVAWDASDVGPPVVWVRGADLDAVALAVADTVAKHQVGVHAMQRHSISLDALRAAAVERGRKPAMVSVAGPLQPHIEGR